MVPLSYIIDVDYTEIRTCVKLYLNTPHEGWKLLHSKVKNMLMDRMWLHYDYGLPNLKLEDFVYFEKGRILYWQYPKGQTFVKIIVHKDGRYGIKT